MNKVATDLLYRVSYQVKRIANLRHTPASNSINKSYWLYPPTEDQAPHKSNAYLGDSAFTIFIFLHLPKSLKRYSPPPL